MIGWLMGVATICSVGPATLFCVNLGRYREPGSPMARRVSILIPARNEVAGIGAAVEAALASRIATVEVLVMDDSSEDGTAEVVEAIALRDSRVRLLRAPQLPPGWNGKQHACWALAEAAQYDLMCFVDADVRLEPEAVARMGRFMGGKGLISGFPREVTGTWMEWMLLPLIHFVLLGFLPLDRMRKYPPDPAMAAGCGQFMMVQRKAYLACGGHAAIKTTMHDGLLLPRLFRSNGFRTDLADLTRLASCRMYTTTAQVWNGLAKNATEGIADPRRIVPISLLLFAGQVLPFLLVFRSRWALFGMVAAWLPRAIGIWRFKQDWRGALLHPLGIVLLLGVQWYALGRKMLGRSVRWKTRSYVGE